MGMYPKIQDKVIEEIHHVLGNKNQLELDDLSKLVYQEMCIRDVLRLFPIAPFIMRTSAEDFQIGTTRAF
jgi:cytochrome P450